MKVSKKIVILRLIITAAICYGVYMETGIWTTIAVASLTVANEISALAKKIA